MKPVYRNVCKVCGYRTGYAWKFYRHERKQHAALLPKKRVSA